MRLKENKKDTRITLKTSDLHLEAHRLKNATIRVGGTVHDINRGISGT